MNGAYVCDARHVNFLCSSSVALHCKSTPISSHEINMNISGCNDNRGLLLHVSTDVLRTGFKQSGHPPPTGSWKMYMSLHLVFMDKI